MNNLLKKTIIHHIFNRFDLFTSKSISENLLLDQKLMFETDEKQYVNDIWSGETTIDNSRVQFIVAELTEEIPEYALLLQLDSFPPYALRISLDNDDSGSISFKADGVWIEASSLIQARILVAVESLIEEIHTTWIKNNNVLTIHKELINFLKFESDNA